jgi:hypothetical protein
MGNATKRIFIAPNIKMEFVKAALMAFSLIPTENAKKDYSAAPTSTEFVLLALLLSLSSQEAVLLLDALNILHKVALSVILV